MRVRPVTAEIVRPLRGEVLRPGQPAERLAFAGDDDPESLHLAAILKGEVVGVASMIAQGHPGGGQGGEWRIRGMATRPDMRGLGVGARLLARCEAHARELHGTRLWCNARDGARGFYERAGWAVEGERFEIAGIGPHWLMSKALERR